MTGGQDDPPGVDHHLKRYFTDDEVAERFSVSRRTVARWRDTGLIGFLRLPGGQKILYLARHLIAFEKLLTRRAKRERGRPRKIKGELDHGRVKQL